MAFVRRRKTKSGGLSTALVEAYRDASGRPRQRILANLYGAETPLEALAKLAAQRERLRKEAAKLAPDLEKAEQVYATITGNVQAGHVYGGDDRRDIDWMFRLRERIRKRIAKIKTDLARIEKDGAAIRKHCNASQAEIQTAFRRYKKQLDDAEMAILGAALRHHEAKEELRRLSPFSAEEMHGNPRRLANRSM